jgi:hypothetical protein
MDRAGQKAGLTYSGVEGIGMQDASLQESMGPIQDRTREQLVSTDNGIIMTRRALLKAARANREGRPLPGLKAADQQVRSCSIELPVATAYAEGARHGLFAPPDTDPVSV